MIKKRILDIFKPIAVFIYAKLINFWLYTLQKFSNKDYIYPQYISFGDTYMFYLYNYTKIKSENKKIIIFGHTDSKFIELIFERHQYIYNPFFLFKFSPEHLVNTKLINENYFKPYICDYTKVRNRPSIKNLIDYNFKKKVKKISNNIIKLKNEKYFLFFIKYYNDDINNISGSGTRQTANFVKVKKLIQFMLDNNYKVLVMGNNFDKSIEKIKKLDFKDKKENVLFFNELSDHYALGDQIYVVNNSLGYVGNGCGFTEPVYFQRKIGVIFDIPFDPIRFPRHNLNFRKFLYKKIKIDNKETIFKCDQEKDILSKNINYQIIETPLEEIVSEIKKNFFK